MTRGTLLAVVLACSAPAVAGGSCQSTPRPSSSAASSGDPKLRHDRRPPRSAPSPPRSGGQDGRTVFWSTKAGSAASRSSTSAGANLRPESIYDSLTRTFVRRPRTENYGHRSILGLPQSESTRETSSNRGKL